VLPMEDLNLHFTGDIHAVGAAHNLLAAMLDASILHGNPLYIDALSIDWRRVLDISDRALRRIVIGRGGRPNGYPRETGFDITAASEVMAILAVARDLRDLRRRLGAITVARSHDGHPVTAEQLGAAGAMTVLLRDALKPNLVQTLEGQPCLVHTGSFANVAHGNSSLIADLIALKLGEFVVTESGFGADLGLEKLLHLVCRPNGVVPSCVVLVCTVRALKHHAGLAGEPGIRGRALAAIEAGAPNLRHHVQLVDRFGLPCVVAINRRAGDTDEELELVRRLALESGAFRAEVSEGYARGGTGALALAEAVIDACAQPTALRFLYDEDDPIVAKIEAIAKHAYGAGDVYLYPEAAVKIARFDADGLKQLPICMAKTQLSLSDDPLALNAPRGFRLAVRDIRAQTGAGWLVPLCGEVTQMPGLGAVPTAVDVDIDAAGRTTGLL
jgi:formate--tetrahydrofolate ligase